MTPAALIYERLRSDVGISSLTVAHWIGAAQAVEAEPLFTIIQFAESLEYSTIDGLASTRATLTISACAPDYDRAFELAEVVRNSLHNLDGVADTKYSFSTISFSNLGNAAIERQGQQTIYIIPQVFTCTLRRL